MVRFLKAGSVCNNIHSTPKPPQQEAISWPPPAPLPYHYTAGAYCVIVSISFSLDLDPIFVIVTANVLS